MVYYFNPTYMNEYMTNTTTLILTIQHPWTSWQNSHLASRGGKVGGSSIEQEEEKGW